MQATGEASWTQAKLLEITAQKNATTTPTPMREEIMKLDKKEQAWISKGKGSTWRPKGDANNFWRPKGGGKFQTKNWNWWGKGGKDKNKGAKNKNKDRPPWEL